VIARRWHATIAAVVLVAIVVQVIIAVQVPGSPHDVRTGLLRGSTLPGRLIRVFSFFTVLSNLLSGIVSAQLAVRPDRDGRVWRVIRLAALVGITVTGIVYSTVLAQIHQPHGLSETLVNVLVHYVVPIMMVVGWLAFGPRPRIDIATVLWSLLYPAAWMLYTLIRGAIWKWYPYPFVDVTTHGYGRVALNALGVVVVLGAVAAFFAVGDRWLAPTPAQAGRNRSADHVSSSEI
jgi:hypothetical protein